ncbi:hypothetical+protein [Methylocapsa aurea]
MRETAHPSEALARRLRGFLPLSAHCRSPLLKTLRGYAPNVAAPSHVLVTGVYDMGGSVGLMCRIDLGGEIAASAVLVVPITHLAFDRRHPISRDMANYRRLHAGRLEAKGSQE